MHQALPSKGRAGVPMRLYRHRRRGASPIVLAAAIAVAALSLLPVGFVLVVLFQSGWDTASALLFRPRIGELLINTMLLEVLAVPLSIALALASAWLTERSDLKWRALWRWLAVAPLAIPAFVQAYAWDSHSCAARPLASGSRISSLPISRWSTCRSSPNCVGSIPPWKTWQRPSAHKPLGVFSWRVVLPQLRLAISGGALLIALHLLSEYGLYVLIRYDTLTVAIVSQFQACL